MYKIPILGHDISQTTNFSANPLQNRTNSTLKMFYKIKQY
jgi:hypothetical protein